MNFWIPAAIFGGIGFALIMTMVFDLPKLRGGTVAACCVMD